MKYCLLCMLMCGYTMYAQTNTSVGRFKECSFVDLLHIEFEGVDIDFGSGDNKYSDYELCIEDQENRTIPNPKYVGKRFIIMWEMKETKVTANPLEPWKTETKKTSSIISLELID